LLPRLLYPEYQMKKGPLDGVLVADFSHGVAGPFCSMYLGDLGATVIKVERPGRGDATRYMSVSDRFSSAIPIEGGDYFLGINRNKQSVTLDLKTPEGAELAKRLAERADVAVENFSKGVMDRLGLGYEDLREANPKLVYCSLRAYGDEGPLAEEVGMDVAIQARSGVMRVTGHPGSSPVKPGSSLADLAGGLHAALGVLAALIERGISGVGQKIDISLLDATAMMLVNYSVPVLNSDVEIGPMGSGHPQLVPFEAFETADDWVIVAAGTNSRWRRFCAAIERPELADDERFKSNDLRVRNRAELTTLLGAEMSRRPTVEWEAIFREHGVPFAPILGLREAFEQPQLEATGLVRSVEHPTLGPLRIFGNAIRMSANELSTDVPPPRLGEHTRQVLGERLGVSGAEFEDLRRRGIVSDDSEAA
jgi:crotonobetainyl-CoA:carnitine CoA-transferase CaiB-like acyl-CoA transferase